MIFSEETLIAYAAGELDDANRHALELAMRGDPKLAARVRQYQLLHSKVFAAFAPSQDEAVPQRLQAAARSGKVIQLNAVRAARNRPLPPPPPAPESRRWSLHEWAILGATLVAGLLGGAYGFKYLQDDARLASTGAGGTLSAQGELARALSQQLASAAPVQDRVVRIGISFVSKEGEYCRSFVLPGSAGLACRDGASWKIPLMSNSSSAGSGDYRHAASAMPAAVLDAIDQRIDGKALDANAERAARQQGWKR